MKISGGVVSTISSLSTIGGDSTLTTSTIGFISTVGVTSSYLKTALASLTTDDKDPSGVGSGLSTTRSALIGVSRIGVPISGGSTNSVLFISSLWISGAREISTSDGSFCFTCLTQC